MQIKPIASNMTELTFTPKETTAYGDFSVLYSYRHQLQVTATKVHLEQTSTTLLQLANTSTNI